MNGFYSYIENKISEGGIDVCDAVLNKMRRACDHIESMYDCNVVHGIAATYDEESRRRITLHIFGCAFDIVSEIDDFIKALDNADGFYIYNDRDDEEFSMSFEFDL